MNETCPTYLIGPDGKTSLEAVREQVRRDVICPMSSVLGGCHQMPYRDVCVVCGHRQVYTMPSLGVIIDLLHEIDMSRSEVADA